MHRVWASDPMPLAPFRGPVVEEELVLKAPTDVHMELDYRVCACWKLGGGLCLPFSPNLFQK